MGPIIRKTVSTDTLTPDIIISKLFHFHSKAHFYHLQTDTIGKHKLLDELYKDLIESKDEIGEYLLGVQSPKRFGVMKVEPIEPYSDANLVAFINEGFDFTVKIIEYAKSKNLEQLSNLASDLQGSFIKAKLFLTYK